ncbi:MAG: hypothetical protein JWQ18_3817 [Conexibacter sp.]|nr:hypothetical protein [Conexibacter sp.]
MTSTTSMTLHPSRRAARFVVGAALAFLVVLLAASSARADLAFDSVGVALNQPPAINVGDPANPYDDFPYVNADGTFVDPLFSRQAGAHPDLTVAFKVHTNPDGTPAEGVRDVDVDLPKGLVGNPTGVPTCRPADLVNPGAGGANCAMGAQIGVAEIVGWASGGRSQVTVGVFNIAHGSDVPARFGFNYSGVIGLVTARVRPGDYGISSGSFAISQGEAIESVRLTIWGVPADASHDWLRQDHVQQIFGNGFNTPQPFRLKTEAPRVPFLTSPPTCSGDPLSFTIRGDSWEHPGVYDTRTVTADEDGTPLLMEGCERVPFKPTADVRPLAHAADAPTGLNFGLQVPQPQDPDGIASAQVRSVKVVFPQGVSVSPSSAAGLGACAPSEINLGTNDPPTCPASSKLGTITIDTPLLDDPLEGDMILAKQNDNPFHSLIAMYIAVKGPGFYLKLPGKIDLDPVTGQVTATFDNTPQLPFSSMQVDFNGGSQAPLATPTACGTYNTHVEVTSWTSDTPVGLDSPMTIDQNCGPKQFAPSFSAGTTNPLAGKYSPFSFTLTRSDGMPFLSQISTALPAGLLANIGSVPECDPTPADAGFCPAESKIGTTSVLSGPGAQPLGLTGNVYLTGPYKDAPFGLSIAVPTAGQAGPFDLGVVVVRAGIYVDRKAHVTVKSDPLPTIIQGIQLRLRQVNVTLDRPNFTFNPTSCAKQSIFGSFQALGGGSSDQTVAFQPGGCGDLDLNQKLAFKLTGKNTTTDGTHPGVSATLTDSGGGANLAKVEAKLPLSLALDPDNAQGLCKPEERVALNCPKASIVGQAKVVSVLKDPLTGPVYFVEGLRKSATGRTIKTLPKLWIPLSGDGVTIDLDADSAVDSSERLVTTFHDIPDAPIKSVSLNIDGGKHGILVVSGKPSTCERDRNFDIRLTGQNNATKVSTAKAAIEGCKPSVKSAKSSSKSVTLRVGNLGAGKLTVSAGGLLTRASRTLRSGTEASITAKLTSKARASLRRHAKVSLRVSVAFSPKGGKALVATKSITVRR